MNTKHTPLPWDVDGFNLTAIIVHDEKNKPHGWRNIICGVHGSSEIQTDEAIANIRFIVRACNSHDELVALCKASRGVIEDFLKDNPDLKELRDSLDEAIAKAEQC